MMHKRRSTLLRLAAMVCVAATALVGCGDLPQSDGGSKPTIINEPEAPSQSPSPTTPISSPAQTTEPEEIYPNKVVESPLTQNGETIECDDSSYPVNVKFNDSVTIRGITIVSKLENGSLTINISPENSSIHAGLLNGYIPFLIPDTDEQPLASNVVISLENFSEIDTVMLCMDKG